MIVVGWCSCVMFLFCKLKAAYELRISDWSSGVCSSDLKTGAGKARQQADIAALETELSESLGTRVSVVHGRSGKEIGRASCRERVCQYVWISVVALSLKKKEQQSDKGKKAKEHIYEMQAAAEELRTTKTEDETTK